MSLGIALATDATFSLILTFCLKCNTGYFTLNSHWLFSQQRAAKSFKRHCINVQIER